MLVLFCILFAATSVSALYVAHNLHKVAYARYIYYRKHLNLSPEDAMHRLEGDFSPRICGRSIAAQFHAAWLQGDIPIRPFVEMTLFPPRARAIEIE